MTEEAKTLIEDKKSKKKHHHHKHKRKKQRSTEFSFDLPGVVKIVLNESVQKALQCLVGDDVTAENPWTTVRKYLIQEQVEMEEILPEFEPFIPMKAEIIAFPNEDMLIGYIPDEQRPYDEFYFCVTAESQKSVEKIIEEIRYIKESRLHNAMYRVIHDWQTLDSGIEIEENIPKNTRGFYRIELETKYPILNKNVILEMRTVEQARDGYFELKIPPRYMVDNIYKTRIDNASQIGPSVSEKEAQTDYPFPQNQYTQYEYQCDFENVTKEFSETFQTFFKDNIDPLCDKLYVNSNINFYTNDYLKLYSKPINIQREQKKVEFMSFKDVISCKDKMIGAFSWHPLWTGIFAVSYLSYSPYWFHSAKFVVDYKKDINYSVNPVLLWSFDDGLKPKLIMETPYEVVCLKFCPHNENILIGGTKNGQVIVWDISNKIHKVEEEEILTTAQQRYRTLMFSMMTWMKNTRDHSKVPQTVSTSVNFGHQLNVTSIRFVHPLYEMNKSGHFEEIGENEGYSLQFATSSADGTIKFWNLKQRPVLMPGEYRQQRKLRRLKKRPSTLTMDVSPYRILNRVMRPHFQINVFRKNQYLNVPIVTFLLKQEGVLLEDLPVDLNKHDFKERLYYKPRVPLDTKKPKMQIMMGSACGEFISAKWEGFEYLCSDPVCNDFARITTIEKYHDGPLLTLQEHPHVKNVYLSVGGKVFAIWADHFHKRPVIWRRCRRHRYTYGAWSTVSAGALRLNRSDGNRETWQFATKSDTFHMAFAYSGRAIFQSHSSPFPGPRKFFTTTDFDGTVHVNVVGTYDDSRSASQWEAFENVINNNVKVKEDFDNWQIKWMETNEEYILKHQEELKLEEELRKEREEEEKKLEEERRQREEELAAKLAYLKNRPPPGQYEKWAHEQWILKEQDRMGNVLLSKKGLDKDSLMAQQKPLKELEAEQEKRRHKQRERLQQADIIFSNTISMLFPNLSDDKAKGPPEAEASPEEIKEIKRQYFSIYDEITDESDQFVLNNEFKFHFDWEEIVASSKLKRYQKDFKYQDAHKGRMEMEKAYRKDEGDEKYDIIDDGSEEEEVEEEEEEGDGKDDLFVDDLDYLDD